VVPGRISSIRLQPEPLMVSAITAVGRPSARLEERSEDGLAVVPVDRGGGPAEGAELGRQIAEPQGSVRRMVVIHDTGQTGQPMMGGQKRRLPDGPFVAFSVPYQTKTRRSIFRISFQRNADGVGQAMPRDPVDASIPGTLSRSG